ncbi:MAG: hypothetical protein HXX09_11495, partial [Bacteroidetes bacterium]|nr:hypothetical protein [Bacteroidota bacterium]
MFLLFSLQSLHAQDKYTVDPVDPTNERNYDEFTVMYNLNGFGYFATEALYFSNNNKLYISVYQLFNELRINCKASSNSDSLSGFIENESNKYNIDFKNKIINIQNKKVELNDALLKINDALYLESSMFGDLFRLNLNFDFKSLTIAISSDFELPIIKIQRILRIRNNISKLKSEIVADTLIKRENHIFKFGTIDWGFSAAQTNAISANNTFQLGVGAELLGGSAQIQLRHFDKYAFDMRQQSYRWNWANNDNKIIKQVSLGKISTSSISSIYSSVLGAKITNAGVGYRKAAGEYSINGFTQPNWMVELYINNALVEVKEADAIGFYIFKFPLSYGQIVITLKFYGPSGEEKTEEKILNIPYTFVPAKKFEYNITTGVLEDGRSTKFFRSENNYGINPFITVGAGLEYLSSITNHSYIPFSNISVQPFRRVIVNGIYAHNVYTKGQMNVSLFKNVFLELGYTKYVDGQTAVMQNYRDEKAAKVSMPFHIRKISGFARLDYTNFGYQHFYYNQYGASFSLFYGNFSTNLASNLNQINPISDNENITPYSAYINANWTILYRFRSNFVLRQSLQYNVSEKSLVSSRTDLEKKIKNRTYVSVSFDRNFIADYNSLNFNVKFDLNYLRVFANSRFTKKDVYTYEGAQGSIYFNSSRNIIQPDNSSAVGKGGISLVPFVDINHNGKKEEDEPMIKLTSVRISGGKVIFNSKDSTINVIGLEPFTNYKLELNENDFNNLSWKLKHKTYQITIDPNQIKTVLIPITPVGEVSGMVYLSKNDKLEGYSRIIVHIYDNAGNIVKEILTESEGYFNYLGLSPGVYSASVDKAQLKKLGFLSIPDENKFTIRPLLDGDIVSDLKFILNNSKPEIDINNAQKLNKETIDSLKKNTNGSNPTGINNKNAIDSLNQNNHGIDNKNAIDSLKKNTNGSNPTGIN